MATFQAQVEGLTGLGTLSASTNPSLDELSQFLKDGVLDVTERWLNVKPLDANLFLRLSSEQTANDSLDLNGAKIVSVVREDGITSDNLRSCRLIAPSMQYIVTDTTSLTYASKFNPVYMIGENGKISVFPVASSGGLNSFWVYYVNNVPEDQTNSAALVYSHSDIKYFVDDKVYLVVMYAAIKSLEAKMAEYVIDEEDQELVTAISSNLLSLKQQYDTAFSIMRPPPPPPEPPQQGARR